MPQSAKQVTKKICELTNWKYNNIHLQKILYFCELVYIGRYREPLLDGNFQAWDCGPVQPQLFEELKVFGDRPVKNIFSNVQDLRDDEIIKFLKHIVVKLQQFSGTRLVALMHSTNSAWTWVYDPYKDYPTIPKEYILIEYNKRFKDTPEGIE